MANRAITDYSELAVTPASGDLIEIVDISEAVAADKNKKIQFSTLQTGALAALIQGIPFAISGSGFAITTGYKGHIKVPFPKCTLVRVDIESDLSTTTVIDLWHCTYAEYDASSTHPVDGDSITGGNELTITAALKATDSTLTSWTTTGFITGDCFGINVDSNDNAKKLIVTPYFQWVV